MWNSVQSLQLFYNSKTVPRQMGYFTKLGQGILAVGQPQIPKLVKTIQSLDPEGSPNRDQGLQPFWKHSVWIPQI